MGLSVLIVSSTVIVAIKLFERICQVRYQAESWKMARRVSEGRGSLLAEPGGWPGKYVEAKLGDVIT
jgi:hypothetical protein